MRLYKKERIFYLETRYRTFKFEYNYWNPLDRIGFQKSFNFWSRGIMCPQFRFTFVFICFGIELQMYSNGF